MYNNIIKRNQDRLLKRSINRNKMYLTTHTKCAACNKKIQQKDAIKKLQHENI